MALQAEAIVSQSKQQKPPTIVHPWSSNYEPQEKSPNQQNIFRAYDNMFGKVCKLTIDDGNCYNINTKVLDWHLGLEIETQPKLYMEVDKSCEGIVRWVVIGPAVYPKQPMSAHEF
nr:uncharacterized protein LOC109163967 [Ipomoea batatas]